MCRKQLTKQFGCCRRSTSHVYFDASIDQPKERIDVAEHTQNTTICCPIGIQIVPFQFTHIRHQLFNFSRFTSITETGHDVHDDVFLFYERAHPIDPLFIMTTIPRCTIGHCTSVLRDTLLTLFDSLCLYQNSIKQMSTYPFL